MCCDRDQDLNDPPVTLHVIYWQIQLPLGLVTIAQCNNYSYPSMPEDKLWLNVMFRWLEIFGFWSYNSKCDQKGMYPDQGLLWFYIRQMLGYCHVLFLAWWVWCLYILCLSISYIAINMSVVGNAVTVYVCVY